MNITARILYHGEFPDKKQAEDEHIRVQVALELYYQWLNKLPEEGLIIGTDEEDEEYEVTAVTVYPHLKEVTVFVTSVS